MKNYETILTQVKRDPLIYQAKIGKENSPDIKLRIRR